MENIYDKVNVLKKHKISPEQMLLENNISIECEKEIEKILAVNASVDLDLPIEAISSECMISGKVIINLVYCTDDAEIGSQTSVSPFSYKLTCEEIEKLSRLNARATVVNTEVEKVNGNLIKVLTTINFDGVVIKNSELSYLKDGGDNTFIKHSEKEVLALAGKYCEKFEESLELNVKTGVKKILMSNVECVVREWEVGTNFVSVVCDLYAKILYADNQEISELQTVTVSKSIKQEIEAEGINKDFDLDLTAIVINDGAGVELAENGEDINIIVNVPIVVCFNSYERKNILTIEDIYSTKHVLSVQNDDAESCKTLKPEILEGKVEGNVVLGDEQARIDKYLTTTNASVSVSNSYVLGGSLVIEGIVSANVIYLNDELEALQSVAIEIPFVMDKNVDLADGVLLEPIVGLFDVDVIVKRGREIFFDAKAKAYVNVSCSNNFSIITKVEEIGEHVERDNAIEIYFAKTGETFWEIAKNLKISSEIIRNQNPELSDPLDKDQNIALYFQKERKA